MDDLISRAAAIDYLMTNMGWRDEDGYEVDDANEKRAIITDLVNGIPAIDAVPVVRARWIATKIPANTTGHGGIGQDKKNGWICSNCRCAFDAKLLWRQNYCQNCGAKMDSDGDG
jgi:hypothetical protein